MRLSRRASALDFDHTSSMAGYSCWKIVFDQTPLYVGI